MEPCCWAPQTTLRLPNAPSSHLVDKARPPAGRNEARTPTHKSFCALTPDTHLLPQEAAPRAPWRGWGDSARWRTGHLPLGQLATQHQTPEPSPTHCPSHPRGTWEPGMVSEGAPCPAPPVPAGGPQNAQQPQHHDQASPPLPSVTGLMKTFRCRFKNTQGLHGFSTTKPLSDRALLDTLPPASGGCDGLPAARSTRCEGRPRATETRCPSRGARTGKEAASCHTCAVSAGRTLPADPGCPRSLRSGRKANPDLCPLRVPVQVQ